MPKVLTRRERQEKTRELLLAAVSDEVLGEFVAAILGCSIAVGEHG